MLSGITNESSIEQIQKVQEVLCEKALQYRIRQMELAQENV